MNKKQKVVLWLGTIAFIIFGSITDSTKTFGGLPSGVSLAHKDSYPEMIVVTDYGPLVSRLLSVVIATSVLLITFKDKKSKDN